ncbi:hypothetical protein M3194_24100 [Paenibacillus glycanilyticus]|uniref:hypothetical protein n=1 Tax=Paenibacillus glycanilyticus TaxID=126569 RepID=UPI00203D0DD9|nr:hypothetical protein [Paenibacillus glycanilyticus]MCM3630419.1 hypothetical protein [Paenibacillus glycanilyticus]
MKKIYLRCSITVLLFIAALIVWNLQREESINRQAKIQIEAALHAGIVDIALAAPREYLKENNAFYPVISPFTASQEDKAKLYDMVFSKINEDANSPISKIVEVDLHDDLGYISARAKVQHKNLFGMTKTKSYGASEPVPAFVAKTGKEEKII